jgi:HlyD family secretion protein
MRIITNFLLCPLLILLPACGRGSGNFDAEGTFEATEVLVSSEATGRILQLNIQEGQVLKAGQVIGNIERLQLSLQRRQLLANIDNAESRRPNEKIQIAPLEEELAKAKFDRERIERQLKDGVATQKQMDDINAQVDLLERQLAAQKTSIDSANQGISDEIASLKLQIKQLDDQLEKCRIISPINGTVLVKYAEEGELATQGKALFKIADLNTMYLRAYIIASQLSQIKIGQSVKVFADFGKSSYREYPGKVTWVSGKSEFTPKAILTKDERDNLVYAVKIAVSNDGYLKIGMYGRLKIKG